MNSSQREQAEKEVRDDLSKTKEHLLEDVHDESVNTQVEPFAAITRTLARFASLLVILSNESAAISERNEKLQTGLTEHTIALVWLTRLLAVIALFQITILFLQIFHKI